MIDVALATGNSFTLLRELILNEFKKNYKDDPGSIMRGNCAASKITKEYLNKVGLSYLRETLGDLIKDIVESKSMELDPA